MKGLGQVVIIVVFVMLNGNISRTVLSKRTVCLFPPIKGAGITIHIVFEDRHIQEGDSLRKIDKAVASIAIKIRFRVN